MRRKVQRIHFVGNERAQSRSFPQWAAVRLLVEPQAASANTDEAHHAA
ncbi:hypothetical protein [Rugosibacter aromaticivorans]|nr:hypothetical protein [Rugosibacter aromaticivorans]